VDIPAIFRLVHLISARWRGTTDFLGRFDKAYGNIDGVNDALYEDVFQNLTISRRIVRFIPKHSTLLTTLSTS
jgi:hypothetical protein